MAATRQHTSTKSAATGLLIAGSQGASIASATTITITDSIHEVTGSATITTINGGKPGQIMWLIKPTGATWGFGTGGNLVLDASYTPAENRAIQLFSTNGTTWNLSTVGDDKVDVAGDTMTGKLLVSLSTEDDALELRSAKNTAAAVVGPTVYHKRGTANAADDDAMNLVSGKQDSSTTAGAITSAIKQVATSAAHASRTSAITFHTMTSGTAAERVRIAGDGKVGIGTAAPGHQLQVGSGSDASIFTSNTKLMVTGTPNVNIAVRETDSDVEGMFYAAGGAFDTLYIGAATNHPLVLRTNNTDRAHFTAGGLVGINATPAAGEQFVVKAGSTSTYCFAAENAGGTNIGGFSADASSHGSFVVKNSSGTAYITLTGSDGTIKERARTTALGNWTSYTPTLTASTGTWSGGTTTAYFTYIGNTCIVNFHSTATLSGTPTWVQFTLPSGVTSAREIRSGSANTAVWSVAASGTAARLTLSAGSFSSGATDIGTQLIIEMA